MNRNSYWLTRPKQFIPPGGESETRRVKQEGSGLHIGFLFGYTECLRELGFPLFVPIRGVGRIEPTDHLGMIPLQLLPHLRRARLVPGHLIVTDFPLQQLAQPSSRGCTKRGQQVIGIQICYRLLLHTGDSTPFSPLSRKVSYSDPILRFPFLPFITGLDWDKGIRGAMR